MIRGGATTRRDEALRLAGACAGLLALSAGLAFSVNLLRPEATRLPWTGDWDRHIETKAFRAGIPTTFLAGAQSRVADASVVVFDARVPSEYEAGHLPRALNLPVGEAESRIGAFVHLLTPETPLLVYCGGSDCEDALDLALKLREFGFENTTLYPGGYAEWIAYGGIVRAGAAP